MDAPTRTPDPMDGPIKFLLDDTAAVILETALSTYREHEIMDSVSDEETDRARRVHNRLRESHSLGVGARLLIETDAEAQTVLSSLSYYAVPTEARYRQRYVEALTGRLFKHTAASLTDIPLITDAEPDESEDPIQPDDLKEQDQTPTPPGEIDVDIAVNPDP